MMQESQTANYFSTFSMYLFDLSAPETKQSLESPKFNSIPLAAVSDTRSSFRLIALNGPLEDFSPIYPYR